MKKLSVIIFFLSVIMIGCTENRVLHSELKESGEVMYFQGKPFTGVAFEMYNESQLEFEYAYKDGKKILYKSYWENGQIKHETSFKDDKQDGVETGYEENGQKRFQYTYKDGVLLETKTYDDGQLMFRRTYKDGKQVEPL